MEICLKNSGIQNQQVLRIDAETETEISKLETDLVLEKFHIILEKNQIDAIIFQADQAAVLLNLRTA